MYASVEMEDKESILVYISGIFKIKKNYKGDLCVPQWCNK